MSGRSSKSKGYRGEVEVINLLLETIREVYEKMGSPVPELTRSPNGRDIRGIPWLAIEVKRHEPTVGYPEVTQSQIKGWWEQCKSQASATQTPVLFYRANHQPWRIRMYGYIQAGEARVRCPVDITLDIFTVWFRARLAADFTRSGDALSGTG